MKKLSLFLIALTMMLFSCKPEAEKPVGPVVITAEVTDVITNSAKCGGGVSDGGGAVVVERGVCWNTSGNPTVLDILVKDTEGGLGTYISNITDLEHNTTYYVRAYAVNANGVAGYGEEKSFTTRVSTGTENGYGWIDLGLSVKWATCNVGANAPEEYGNYYAWGETTTKSDYSTSNCPTYGLSYSQLQSQGYIDSEGNLNPQYDAATANWGGDWRMPTYAEQKELLNNCTWTWMTQNGVEGYKVTSKVNSNYIFLPATGLHSEYAIIYGGGIYWSSSPYTYTDNDNAYGLYFYFYSDELRTISCNRYGGCSVRPVLE